LNKWESGCVRKFLLLALPTGTPNRTVP
jgi:hypothetical protein